MELWCSGSFAKEYIGYTPDLDRSRDSIEAEKALGRCMARRLRLQFPGARYHIINRGNFRQAVFSTAGAGQAFVTTLDEAAERFRWRLHAYRVVSIPYHLALETPEPILAVGIDSWCILSRLGDRHRRLEASVSQGVCPDPPRSGLGNG